MQRSMLGALRGVAELQPVSGGADQRAVPRVRTDRQAVEVTQGVVGTDADILSIKPFLQGHQSTNAAAVSMASPWWNLSVCLDWASRYETFPSEILKSSRGSFL